METKIPTYYERNQIRNDVSTFLDRAEKTKLHPDQVRGTLDAAARLLQARSGLLPLFEKRRLARQIVWHAAHPENIDNGQHCTSALAALEVRIFSRYPAIAANLIADIALTGRYRSVDQTEVVLNPTAHGDSHLLVCDGKRTHASEIFQVVLANIFLQNSGYRFIQEEPSQDISCPASNDSYAAIAADSCAGDVLLDANGERDTHSRIFDYDAIVKINEAITGELDYDIAIVHKGSLDAHSESSVQIDTEAELLQKLLLLKATERLPVIILIDSDRDFFWSKSARGNSSLSAHAVTVINVLDGAIPTVELDKSWRKQQNHGYTSTTSVAQLHLAMCGGVSPF